MLAAIMIEGHFYNRHTVKGYIVFVMLSGCLFFFVHHAVHQLLRFNFMLNLCFHLVVALVMGKHEPLL